MRNYWYFDDIMDDILSHKKNETFEDYYEILGCDENSTVSLENWSNLRDLHSFNWKQICIKDGTNTLRI